MDGADVAAGAARVVTLDEAALDEARLGFHRSHPAQSAKRRFTVLQLIGLALCGSGIAALYANAPSATLAALYGLSYSVFLAAIALRLAAAAHLRPVLSRLAKHVAWPTYTVLCPLYREASQVDDLMAALTRLDYPVAALDLKLIVEADDSDTVAAAKAAAAGFAHVEVVIVPPAAPRTKPKALNAGLALARGAYVVVYDAEDRPHPLQLRAALAAFEDGGATLACVQAPLVVDNAEASWIARQFAAEYAILFGEILPLLARLGLPLPLGGSSNHFRVAALDASGGWDPFNVREKVRAFAA